MFPWRRPMRRVVGSRAVTICVHNAIKVTYCLLPWKRVTVRKLLCIELWYRSIALGVATTCKRNKPTHWFRAVAYCKQQESMFAATIAHQPKKRSLFNLSSAIPQFYTRVILRNCTTCFGAHVTLLMIKLLFWGCKLNNYCFSCVMYASNTTCLIFTNKTYPIYAYMILR